MDAGTVVVGAGVVGLAVGRALAQSGREVLVLEQAAAIGTATSSRNSGVIHAGIYYPPGSLRAQLCVRGKALLYEYCAARGVAHRRCGKLIVATTSDEVATLERYAATAAANGAGELRRLGPREVAELEPAVQAVAALHSTTTGIVDVHELMQALQADIEAAGGQVVLNTSVQGVAALGSGFRVTLADDTALTCEAFVNSAGLHAPELAARTAGLPPGSWPRSFYARGHYYTLTGRSPFRRLVYPVAVGGGLGTHVTVDLAGRVRFGPDVEWIDSIDYSFGSDRRAEFAAAIRRYYPGIDPERLAPDYTGVRPKISGPGEPAADFRIDGPATHGIAGLVNLFGIESPGLTACLAIGEHVAGLIAP
jgi:L-2-hydroxyglutarate oxidase LhgO